MIKVFKTCIVFVTIISLVGCASIIKGNHQSVYFDTLPTGATLIAKYPNSEPQTFTTPTNMMLPTGKEPYSVEVKKEGYKPLSLTMPSRVSCWFWLNLPLVLIFGLGLITMAADAGSGSAFTFDKSDYKITLEPVSPTEQVNTKK